VVRSAHGSVGAAVLSFFKKYKDGSVGAALLSRRIRSCGVQWISVDGSVWVATKALSEAKALQLNFFFLSDDLTPWFNKCRGKVVFAQISGTRNANVHGFVKLDSDFENIFSLASHLERAFPRFTRFSLEVVLRLVEN